MTELEAKVRFARPALDRTILMILLAVSIPIATAARNLFGEAGSVVLAALLTAGLTLTLARAATLGSLPRRQITLLVGAAPLVVVYMLSTVLRPGPVAFSVTAQLVLVVSFLFGFSLWHWRSEHLRPVFGVLAIFLLAHLLWWAVTGAPSRFRGFMGHANALGLFVLTAAYFPLLVLMTSPRRSAVRAIALLTVAASVLILVATTSRAAWLAGAMTWTVYLIWPYLTRRYLRFMVTLPLAIILAVVGTGLYMTLAHGERGAQLQSLSLKFTGKDFYSGRQKFWEELFNAVSERPWSGYGSGALAESFTGYSWSAHSLYLQITLQVGLVGLVALAVFLWVIWRMLWPRRHLVGTRLAGAFLIGMLFHQMFEVSLTQNNLANGYLIWLALAIGISYEGSP